MYYFNVILIYVKSFRFLNSERDKGCIFSTTMFIMYVYLFFENTFLCQNNAYILYAYSFFITNNR